MTGLLPPIIFLSVSKIWPLSLLRSFLIITLILLFVSINKMRSLKPPAILPIVCLAAFNFAYFLSAVINNSLNQSFLIGLSGRNQGILFWISLSCLYIAYATGTSTFKDLSKYGLLPLSFFVLLVGIFQFISNKDNPMILTLGNSNFAGSLLASTTLILIFQGNKVKNNFIKLSLKLAILLNIFLGITTQALQFPILLVLGLLVSSIFKFKNQFFNSSKKHRFFMIFTFTTLIITSFTSIYIKTISLPTSIDRVDMFKSAIRVWQQNPWFGVGLENLYKFSPQFRTARQVELLGSNVIVDKSHNTILDHFACGGIFVGLSYLGFIFVISFFLVKLYFVKNFDTSHPQFTIPAGLWVIWLAQTQISTDFNLFTLLGFMVAGIISFNFNGVKKEFRSSIITIPRSSKKLVILPLIITILYYIPILEAYSKAPQILSGKIQNASKIEQIMNKISDPLINEEVASYLLKDISNCKFSPKFLNPIYSQNSRSDKYFYWKGLCLAYEGKNKEALIQVKAALNFYPNNLDYLKTCILLGRDLKDFESVSLCQTKAMEISPNKSIVTFK